MGVIPVISKQDFIGTSEDTKPSSGAGSEFFETDTQKTYINTDGGSTWLEKTTTTTIGDVNMMISDSEIGALNPMPTSLVSIPEGASLGADLRVAGAAVAGNNPVPVTSDVTMGGVAVSAEAPLAVVNLGASSSTTDSIAAYGKLDVKRMTVSFTRPNDTTDYAIGDTMADKTADATALVLTDIASANGKGIRINKVVIQSDHPSATAIPETNVWISEVSIAPEDNEALTFTDDQATSILGVINCADRFATAANSFVQASNLADDYVCKSDSRSLYLVLEARATWNTLEQDVISVTVTYSELN